MPTIANANTATKTELRAVVVQDSLTASTTLAPSVTAVNTGLASKADLLAPVTESGTAWTLTAGAHSNRLVIATNAAAITVTINTAGMTTSDGGRIVHGGAGQVTVTGATISYAGGVSATPNIPSGIRNWLDWRFDGTNFVIEQKSEDATGAGSSASSSATAVSGQAPQDANENLLSTITLPTNIPAGSTIQITTLAAFGMNAGGTTPGGGVWLLKLNGTTVQSVPWINATETTLGARSDLTVVMCTGAAAQTSLRTGGSAGTTGDDTAIVNTTVSTSGANTLTVYAQRFSGLTRPASVTTSVVVVKGA